MDQPPANELFHCGVCGKKFGSLLKFRRHKENHVERRYRCTHPGCDYAAIGNSLLQRHLRTHTGEKPFVCVADGCGKSFAAQGNLQKHVRAVHEKSKSYVCEQCSRGFCDKGNLAQHVQAVHEKSRPFFCELCTKRFSERSTLTQHIKAVHEKKKEWKCESCPRQFFAKSALSKHVALVHEKKFRFKCDKCNQGFLHQSRLDRHALSHSTEQTFKCDECEQRFKHTSGLAYHVARVHQNRNMQKPKDHKCDFCPFATSNTAWLRRHVIALHEKTRPYKCTHCPASFADKGACRNHEQLHGTEIFACEQCERKYPSKASLRSHAPVHGEKFPCEFCTYVSSYMKDLKKHVLGRHKDKVQQTVIATHSEAPSRAPDGTLVASKSGVWEKFEQAHGRIGEGRFGNVFRARLRLTGQREPGRYQYAIKGIDLTTVQLAPQTHLRKCQQEVQLMHEARHENVIDVYEFFVSYWEQQPDTFELVMELGCESLTVVNKSYQLTEEQWVFIFAGLAAALKHIHGLRIIHRDVKPDNVVICYNGVPKLCDFGESKRLGEHGTCLRIIHRDVKPDNVVICYNGVPKLCDFGESKRLGEHGTCIGIAGSPMYMAVEMKTRQNPTPYDGKVDVFSFAITAAEVAQKGTFSLDTSNELATRKAISARIGNLSDPLKELVLACVAFDPKKRPSSGDVADALEGFAQRSDASCLANITENFIF